MKFSEAFDLMKSGQYIKLPSWGGYWSWDSDKQTILIHCRNVDRITGKSVLDIRETQQVEYTIQNILSEDWIIANEHNCTLFGGIAVFDFFTAHRYAKKGIKVKRLDWVDKYLHITADNLVRVISLSDSDITDRLLSTEDIEATDWVFL